MANQSTEQSSILSASLSSLPNSGSNGGNNGLEVSGGLTSSDKIAFGVGIPSALGSLVLLKYIYSWYKKRRSRNRGGQDTTSGTRYTSESVPTSGHAGTDTLPLQDLPPPPYQARGVEGSR